MSTSVLQTNAHTCMYVYTQTHTETDTEKSGGGRKTERKPKSPTFKSKLFIITLFGY